MEIITPDFVVVFGELFSIDVSVIFTVVVQDVDGLFVEEFGDFLVFVDHISQITLKIIKEQAEFTFP